MSNIEMQVGTAAERGLNPAAAPVFGLVVYLGSVALNFALNAGEPAEQTVVQWAVTVAAAAVAVLICAAFTRRAMGRGVGSVAGTALVLGVVAVVSMLVFWAGFPCVFGAAAIGLGIQARQGDGRLSGRAAVGLTLGAVAMVSGALLMVVG